jgi:hypothetical protein
MVKAGDMVRSYQWGTLKANVLEVKNALVDSIYTTSQKIVGKGLRIQEQSLAQDRYSSIQEWAIYTCCGILRQLHNAEA